MNTPNKRQDAYPALRVVRASLSGFLAVGVFSFFVNLGALVSPIYMQQIFDRVMQSRHMETLIYLTVIVVAMLAFISALDAIRGAMLARISRWWDDVVQADLFSAIVKSARGRGVSQIQAMNDLMSIRQFVGGSSVLPFFDGPWMPIFLFAISLIHPWLGIVAVAAAVLLLVIAAINDFVTRRHMEGLGSYQARAQLTLDAAARHADSVHAMGMLPGLLARFRIDGQKTADGMYRVGAFTAHMGALSKFIRYSAQIAILGLGAYLATLGEISSGAMIAASIIMGRALAPAEQALGAWRSFVAARNAQRRIRDLFLAVPVEPEKLVQPPPSGLVTFEGVTLALPGMEKPLLRSIDLEVSASQIVAIVGASGCGKSTFCRMLVGAVGPSIGSVRIDGVAIANWEHAQFARNVGYLAQSVELFDGTIAENIARMGEPDGSLVVEAAQMAGCHDLINRLPKGYDTLVGPSGVALSGGQMQRIGLARALYGQPKLLVLDEPNANLDAEGEGALQTALMRMRASGSTVFVVSHRPAALARVDLIVTIENGTISRKQTREEFLRTAAAPVEDLLKRMIANGAKSGGARGGAAEGDLQ
jgi:PrtD family type I secretion system ABC transporter